MASLDNINRLLTVAATLIDRAAAEIRDAKLEPVHENIEILGRALAEVFDLQHRIWVLRPDLAPADLNEPSPCSEANRLLTESMFRASEFERAGNIADAITEFERFAALVSSELHREIALGEIERLKNASRP